MPELPEVEVVRRGLESEVVGRTIGAVTVAHPRAVRRHLPGGADFAARLAGRTIIAARRRGKYLWLPLDDGDALLAHLGMSGQLLVRPTSAPDETHLRVRFTFTDTDDRAESTELRFVDQRTFGGLALAEGGAELPPVISHIARDPLDPEFDDAAFSAALRRRRTGLKRALLDQTLVSGVGNIYADEALWRAMLHYARPTETLKRAQVDAVLAGARDRDGRGAGAGRHVVRRAVRRRQRSERLLRPDPRGLRAGGGALPPVRDAHPARAVHEPLVPLLPALPAPATPRTVVAGVILPR